MAMISVKNFSKKYGEKVVYDNFNLDIEENKILVILGESGSGKTTLLNAMANLTDYDGEILGVNPPVSMVFQKDYLVPNLTVEQNLKLVCKNKDVLKALKSVGMEDSAKSYPKSLSAGMSRRISILRALIFDSALLLMDEPTNSLDIALKNKIYDILKNLKDEYKKTVIVVTHDIDEALSLAERVVVLKGGELIYSYNFKSSLKERDIASEECNNVRREVISKLLGV